MSDEFDDDDLDLDLDESGFDEFDEGGGKTLGDLWQNNAMFKFGVIGAAAVAILGGIFMFGDDEGAAGPSLVPIASDVKAPPGIEEASPVYIEAVEEKNEERVEQAQQSGGSALPTPIEPPVGQLSFEEEQAQKEDPLQRWRQLQEERLQREFEQTQAIAPPVTQTQNEAPVSFQQTPQVNPESVQALADLMMQQMESVLSSQTSQQNIGSTQITSPNYLEDLARQEQEEQIERVEAQIAAAAAEEDTSRVLLMPAGEIVYGQLITEANSDRPGPILAEILSGPLRGGRLLGTFTTQSDLNILEFNTVVLNNQTIAINAIAIDPETTLTGMATDVDHRYFQRVILPTAAAFIEGLASATAEVATVAVPSANGAAAEGSEEPDNDQEVATGIEEAGQALGEILEEMNDDIETLVRIESGTTMGILFLESVAQ